MVHLLKVLPHGLNVSKARKELETPPDEGDSKVSRYLYQTSTSIQARARRRQGFPPVAW